MGISVKKLSLIFIVPIAVFAMLVAPASSLGGFGTQKAAAADPAGNWWDQYYATQDHAWYQCIKGQGSITGPCSGVGYITSVTYSNSRLFTWRVYWSRGNCVAYLHINTNNNYIYRSWGECNGPVVPPPFTR